MVNIGQEIVNINTKIGSETLPLSKDSLSKNII